MPMELLEKEIKTEREKETSLQLPPQTVDPGDAAAASKWLLHLWSFLITCLPSAQCCPQTGGLLHLHLSGSLHRMYFRSPKKNGEA